MSAPIATLTRIAGALGRRLGVVVRHFLPLDQPSPEQARLSRENSSLLDRLFPRDDRKAPDGVLLVLPEVHILNCLQNALLARAAATARNLDVLQLLAPVNPAGLRPLLASHGIRAFASVIAPARLIHLPASLARALVVYLRLRSPDDFLAFKEDGVPFGDLLYDAYLAEGWSTMRRIDRRVFKILVAFYYHRAVIKGLLRREPVRLAVFAHHIGVQNGTYFRYLAAAGVETLRRGGTGVLMFQKLRGLEDGYLEIFTPERSQFETMLAERDAYLPLAEEYIALRLKDKAADLSSHDGNLAFKASKRTYRSREEFAEAFGIDPSKPTVFVMLHAFNDYPHSYGFIITRDFRDWFQLTLDIARRDDKCNWIFKEHPYARYYPTKDLDIDQVFAEVRAPHIRFLPSDADFNANSIPHVCDVIVTCIGTAGLEYASIGIPCVLGGRSSYSGFGFTIEPDSVETYRRTLEQADVLERLEETQRQRALLIMYYELFLAYDAPDPFFPYLGFEQQQHCTQQDLLRLIASHRSGQTPEMLAAGAADLLRFMNDQNSSIYLRR